MIETEGLTGADTLLRVLSHMGVDRIFASPGSEWSPVWEAFAKAKAQSEGVPLYISSRHEEVAVGMASGYAKSTGKLPAVMIHTTVGALHATMALARRAPRAGAHGGVHRRIAWVRRRSGAGRRRAVARCFGRYRRPGAARRPLRQMELWRQREIVIALDHPARLPIGDGLSQGTGLCFAPDGISLRQDDQECVSRKCSYSRAHGRPRQPSTN